MLMSGSKVLRVAVWSFLSMAEARYLQIRHSMQIAALQAGEAAQEIQSSRALGRRTKSGHFDIVTDGDVASQRIVMEQLVKDFPEVPFIAEESIEPPKGVRMASVSDTGDILEGTFWTVDPIDGVRSAKEVTVVLLVLTKAASLRCRRATLLRGGRTGQWH